MSRKLVTNGSVRRLANQWVDLSDDRRRDLLSSLDTESRIKVIENMIKIRVERGHVYMHSRGDLIIICTVKVRGYRVAKFSGFKR